ncbi:IclR family transcriptional regulator C-terminal domain-containing protein [Variovorax sp. J22R133]|uniref:IclR family transcriptional regulator domain-containing protein n=1 Tax=Variovorax brevis TaxID=3053503 RepID=UPI002578A77F|nr:IclR family transcriptional regulator C-terminal domain-containing protein [Variovorax sp. J22R133]MDM0112830.1 IclR family transcriptional regulator C-terminal domain-containing protein [Variovorax sp. J22R133]
MTKDDDGVPPGLDKRDWIAGLERGVSIIEAFDDANARMTASQAGQRTGMTRTAARRYLLTLQHMGYVASDGKLFWLTPRVLRLGQSYLESARLPRIVQPFLQRVAVGTHEIAYLSVMDGDEVVYIARNGPNRSMSTGYVLGARVAAQVTAAGLLMLALRSDEEQAQWLATHDLAVFTSFTIASKERMRLELARIRNQGWALSEQQLDLNSRGIAVPLRDRRGDVVGALNVTMPMGHESTEDAVARVLPVLRETAQAMRNMI